MTISRITGELRRWSRSSDGKTISGYLYGDKLNVFIDGTLRENLIIMSLVDDGDYYVLRTPAYLYKCYKAEEYVKKDGLG